MTTSLLSIYLIVVPSYALAIYLDGESSRHDSYLESIQNYHLGWTSRMTELLKAKECSND